MAIDDVSLDAEERLALVLDELNRERALRRALAAQLAQLQRTDGLTGLPTRVVLEERLDRAITRSRRNGTGIGVLYVGLDQFARIEGELGDVAASDVVRHVARRLSSAIRDIDTVARLGGDHFLILCEDVVHPGDLDAVARRIHDAMAAPILVAGDITSVSASVGSAFLGGDDLNTISPAALLATAEVALAG